MLFCRDLVEFPPSQNTRGRMLPFRSLTLPAGEILLEFEKRLNISAE